MNRESRQRVYDWLRQCLIGPETDARSRDGSPPSGWQELRGIRPLDRYQTGILFPVSNDDTGLDPADPDSEDEDSLAGEKDGDGDGAEATGLSRPKRRVVPPSSVGFSFFVHGEMVEIQLIPAAVVYDRGEERDAAGRFTSETWMPRPFGSGGNEAITIAAPTCPRSPPLRQPVFDGRAELFVLWRRQINGWLVTISLSNTQRIDDAGTGGGPGDRRDEQHADASALFGVELTCQVLKGIVGPYPRTDLALLSDEERELELRYRNHVIYAVGHGAAVDWSLTDGRVTSIRTEFLPCVEVPRVDPEAGKADGAALRVDDLAGILTHRDAICAALDRFVACYGQWIDAQQAECATLGPDLRPSGERVVARMRRAAERMQAGVDLLREDDTAARAFGLANLAMARQMRQAFLMQGGAKKRQAQRNDKAPTWRPFQLAFLLLAIKSAADEDAPERDILDLIWFPTGGGKTEAYLGLMAFVIWYRRLRYKASGGGTTVLMRYTLRLLTKDQFLRAARLICAMELMRREQPKLLGDEPVTLGLWVGGALSPNRFEDAKQLLEQAIENRETQPPSLLVLEKCPWCESPLDLRKGFDAGDQHFHFRCTNRDCAFGVSDDGLLPCNVVDSALYKTPPTLLLATIDKFARLAWEEDTSAFFGRDGNRPPELIIQDELHLIASALGSIAGLYEAGLDTVLRARGMHPKYVASTATIRMAAEQVERLYGRQRLYGDGQDDREAAIFPPPGLNAEDAYFSRTVPATDDKPGRLYIGYLAPARNRQRCLAPLAAALLAAPEALFGNATADREALLDAWWTLLIYHGSLKGVGVSRNALRDIENGIDRLRREWLELKDPADVEGGSGLGPEPWRGQLVEPDRIAHLTSHMSADENARAFARLARSRDDLEALDLALATNMISVGLDVSRLAAMIINGQPLTTAEYIQASSRVGRGAVPGIVITNYYRDQARSLSHYESFRAYHEAFYRFVEPTSVTPFTYQARRRALHAALVISVRHASDDLTANARAASFDPTKPETAKVIELLIQRCRDADPERGDVTEADLHRLVREWAALAARAAKQEQALCYKGSNRDRRGLCLLYAHDDRHKGEWPTLHNMRNVENTSVIRIL